MSQKEEAEKKLFLGTEFQELKVKVAILWSMKRELSNLRYVDLHVINRTVVGPEMMPAVHEIDFRRTSVCDSIGQQLPSFCKGIRKFMQMFHYFGCL